MNIKENPEKTRVLQERREQLANALYTIKTEHSSKSHGDSLTFITSLVDTLATATAAQAIKIGSPSLLIGLRIALQGIESEKSKGGVIGKVLNTAVKGVTDLLVKTCLDREGASNKQLFQLISQALALTTISMTWYLERFNLGYIHGENEEEVESQRKQTFGFELILLCILRAGIVPLIIKNIAATCGVNENELELVTRVMKAFILILAILTAGRGNNEKMKTLSLDLKDDLIEALEDIQNFINKASEAGKTEAGAVSIYIQQALASLQDEDFDTLFRAYSGALEEIQANPELMDKDIEEVTKFAEVINNAFTQGSIEQLNRKTASLMI